MSLDVRTIVVVLLVSQLLMSATLALDLRSGRAPGLIRWNLGLGLFATGWLLIALRAVLPAVIGIGFADALLLAGLCSQYAALLEFGGRPVPAWLVPVPATLLFIVLLPLLDDYAGLTLVSSAVYALAFVALSVVTERLGERAGPVRWLSAAMLLVAAVVLMARAADIALHPAETPEVFTAKALHGFAFIMLLAVTVSSSFSFMVMHRRAAEARIRQIAMYDGLTRLYNRRAFLEIAEREAARARRAAGPTAALMLDLDHFKRVNDSHGHAAGDRLLADFAERLRGAVRGADIPGRYGGEEFCVLLPGATVEEAAVVAERIREAVAARPLGGLVQAVTMSAGAAGSTYSDCSVDELLAQADAALYAAKRSGRNRVVVSGRRAIAA
jgi:diguanylate cyclase (GGDEF)-like protein